MNKELQARVVGQGAARSCGVLTASTHGDVDCLPHPHPNAFRADVTRARNGQSSKHSHHENVETHLSACSLVLPCLRPIPPDILQSEHSSRRRACSLLAFLGALAANCSSVAAARPRASSACLSLLAPSALGAPRRQSLLFHGTCGHLVQCIWPSSACVTRTHVSFRRCAVPDPGAGSCVRSTKRHFRS